jgi:GntR family transcriptional regulator/MocR family aminotransferase
MIEAGTNPETTRKAPLAATGLPDFVLRQFKLGQPSHQQLYGILQAGIRDGSLAAGLRLPPTRVLARTLGIARNTVVHVYEQLTFEGYVQARVGRGTFVADVFPRPVVAAGKFPLDRNAPLSRRGERTVREALAARLQWGAFAPGVPELRMFPIQTWNRLQARVWRRVEPERLSYATGHGDAGLREAIADYLRGTRGIACTPAQVVITSGTQQSLHLVAQLLADPGDRVWLEDPGYWGARSVFHATGLESVAVAVDGEGLAPSAAQWAEPPRLVFVSPSHQYPTGAHMSLARRRQLLDYAAQHGVWVIEDDYDSEFRYDAHPLSALQALDESGRVIYLGTFSKTLFPALRLAYLVLPPDLVDGFARALRELFREGQTMQQAVLARFLAEGHYAAHIRRMRGVYRARHDALMDAIRREFGEAVPVIGAEAGLHMILGLPRTVDDVAVMERGLYAGVATRPLSIYHLNPEAAARGLLLGYGSVPEEEIGPQLGRLAGAVTPFL